MNSANDPSLQHQEVVPFFQPFYNLQTGRLQGWEALARKRDDSGDGGALPAHLTKSSAPAGLRDIDLRVLDGALGHLAAWRAASGSTDQIVAVNLSGELVDDGLLVEDITGALARHQVPGDRLLVDLTTTGFRRLAGHETALGRLRSLQEHEITFCVDGFTIGDLDVLDDAAESRVDVIKLHPRQVNSTDDDHAGQLERIAAAAQEHELPVVAAGIETPEQLALVRRLGFEWAQGFLLGAPVPVEDISIHPLELAWPGEPA